jgi:hypothetical protein
MSVACRDSWPGSRPPCPGLPSRRSHAIGYAAGRRRMSDAIVV